MHATKKAEKARAGGFRALIKAMRPAEWAKSGFVLAPIVFGGRLLEWPAWQAVLMAAGSFSLAASAAYLFNDVMDRRSDAVHPLKRLRPLASGELDVRTACVAALGLALISLAGASLVRPALAVILAVYFGLSLVYTLLLKKLMLVDALAVAAGFVLRVVAGAIAAGVVASHWLLLCTFLLAVFMAFGKRRYEIASLQSEAVLHRAVLHGYSVQLLDGMNHALLGATIVAYALYTTSDETVQRFRTTALVYTIPFVMYGLLRYYALTQRGDARTGSPSAVALSDLPLIICVLSWAAACAAIIYLS